MPVRMLDCELPLSGAGLSRMGLSGLQCGCGINLQQGWLNVDVTCLTDGAGESTEPSRVALLGTRLNYLQADLTEPLPIEDDAVTRVYSEHLVEHLAFTAPWAGCRRCGG